MIRVFYLYEQRTKIPLLKSRYTTVTHILFLNDETSVIFYFLNDETSVIFYFLNDET